MAEFWIGYVMLGQAYEPLGQNDLALEALTTASRSSRHNSKSTSLRGYVVAKAGRASEARDLLTTLECELTVKGGQVVWDLNGISHTSWTEMTETTRRRWW